MSGFVDGPVTAVSGRTGDGNDVAMNANPRTSPALNRPLPAGRPVMTSRQLRAYGVPPAAVAEPKSVKWKRLVPEPPRTWTLVTPSE